MRDHARKNALILEIMCRTPIPWSEDLEVLMTETIDQSDNLELREQYDMLKLKKMLGKYNLKGSISTSLSNARGTVSV